MTKQLELFLNIDDKLYLADAISMHGQLSQEEKAVYLEMFMGDGLPFESADIHILLAMSGIANAEIDCSDIYTAIKIEFPPSIMDICQEKGHVGRVLSPSPDVYSYMICFNIDSFILLLNRTLNPEQTMSTKYRRSMIDNYIAVAKLFCSVHCCFNEVFEMTLANLSVRIDPDEVGEMSRCKICPCCRGKIADMYNPIVIYSQPSLRNLSIQLKNLLIIFGMFHILALSYFIAIDKDRMYGNASFSSLSCFS